MLPEIGRILDLTQPFYHNCPGPPIFPLPEVERTNIAARDVFNMERLSFVTHTGTHIDAPYHFIEDGRTVDLIDLRQLQGPAVVVELYDKNPDEPITDADLARYDAQIDSESIVLLCTGWGYKRDFTKEYIYQPPWMSIEGANYLVQKGIKGVGIDHFSLSGNEFERAVPPHIELLKSDIWIIEDMFLPRELLECDDWHVVALPMLLKGGSGGPIRVVAVEYCENGRV